VAGVIPHFAHPFRVEGGKVAVVDQNSPDEIWTCVETIVRFFKGDRLAVPDFGIVEPTFTTGPIDTDKIRAVVEKWEERAGVLITEHPDRFDEVVRRVLIELKGTDDV
jgi:hypothetical protein